MRYRRSIFLVAVVVLLAATATPGQLPLEPARDSGQSVTGSFEGWYQNPDGTYNLLVGYFNRNNKEELDIPAGPNNRIEPGNPDQGQPTHFNPRRQWGVFVITVPKDFGKKRLTWTIVANGQTTAIPLNLNPLWVVEPLKDIATGNTPPSLKFQADGKSFLGPPVGIAANFTAKASDALPLDMWFNDLGRSDVEPPAAGAARGGGGARGTVSWSKFRGPGSVTFANARPSINAQDGKTSTTAKFSAPGEYILRAQANDSTGEGGGGFQCCWTSVHVKVTVAPSTSAQP